ncbi:hypothetical protein ACLOJK_008601 [Asimina triloba]
MKLLVEAIGMEVSSADSAQGWVKGGIIHGDIVQPNHGFQPEESIESCMADIPKGKANTPTSKQVIHSFYFVRLRPYEDCMMKLEEAEEDRRRISRKSFRLSKELSRKQYLHLNRINQQSQALSLEDSQYEQVLRNKMRELKPPFHAALAKLHHPHNITTKMEENLCSSERELNCVMKRLSHCLQHKSDTSVKERQVLREMKLLERTREEVVAKSLKDKSDHEYSFGPEKAIQDQFAGLGLERAKKEHQTNKKRIREKMGLLEDERKFKEEKIRLLEKEYQTVKTQLKETHETVLELRKEYMTLNSYFFQGEESLSDVKKNAEKNHIATLKMLSHLQVEKFMAQWNSNKTFRQKYIRTSTLPSLESRELCSDGRLRNPDEKIMVSEAGGALEKASSTIHKNK